MEQPEDNCGISSEDHFLWALGLADRAASEQIRSHLSSRCVSCTSALKDALQFWAAYGAAAGIEAQAIPSPHVRDKLLARIRETSEPKVVAMPRRGPKLAYAGAIAAGLVGAAFVGSQFGPRATTPSTVTVQAPDPAAEDLRAQVAGLRARLAEAQREAASLGAAAPPSSPSPVTPVRLGQNAALDCGPEIDRALADANQQMQQLRASVAGEQAKAARLAQEFDQQSAAFASQSRERRDAEANLAVATARLAERDRQVKALDAKITQLERDRDRLNDALNNQRMRVDHAGRLVAILNAPSTKLVRMAGTEAAPTASGYALVDESGRLIFSGTNLPQLQPGRIYQLWLMRGRGPGVVSAGVFTGGQTLEFTNPNLLRDVRALAVTEEPGGGSPLPTGHKVLIGTARS